MNERPSCPPSISTLTPWRQAFLEQTAAECSKCSRALPNYWQRVQWNEFDGKGRQTVCIECWATAAPSDPVDGSNSQWRRELADQLYAALAAEGLAP